MLPNQETHYRGSDKKWEAPREAKRNVGNHVSFKNSRGSDDSFLNDSFLQNSLFPFHLVSQFLNLYRCYRSFINFYLNYPTFRFRPLAFSLHAGLPTFDRYRDRSIKTAKHALFHILLSYPAAPAILPILFFLFSS